MSIGIHRLAIAAAALAALALVFAGPDVSAKRRSQEVAWYQYSAQFTCGPNDASEGRAVPAVYATAINIHNPYPTEVILRKHIALTYPPELQAVGAVSDVIMENLDRRSALQVDCGEILSDEFDFADPPGTDYVQGFLVIESRRSLDVAATYSATGEDDEVSVDAEVIPERIIMRPADDEQLLICHVPPGNPDNDHEIEIGVDAWPAHHGHGDHLGECDD